MHDKIKQKQSIKQQSVQENIKPQAGNSNKNIKQQTGDPTKNMKPQTGNSNKNINQQAGDPNKNIKQQTGDPITNIKQQAESLNKIKAKQGQQKEQASGKRLQSREQFQQSQDQVMSQIYFYFDRNQDLCNFTKQSKDFYSNSNSSMIQLIMNNRLLTYYLAHQFYYYTNKFLQIFQQKKTFYTVSAEQVREALEDEAFQQQVEQLKVNLQKTKKLIHSSFKSCKVYLKKSQQELKIQVVNYHQICLQFLKKQFKDVYEIYAKTNTNRSAAKRCSYLIQIWCTLHLLNKHQLKQHEDVQDIQDIDLHIKTFRHLIPIE